MIESAAQRCDSALVRRVDPLEAVVPWPRIGNAMLKFNG
jgi:hypothetical protein